MTSFQNSRSAELCSEAQSLAFKAVCKLYDAVHELNGGQANESHPGRDAVSMSEDSRQALAVSEKAWLLETSDDEICVLVSVL